MTYELYAIISHHVNDVIYIIFDTAYTRTYAWYVVCSIYIYIICINHVKFAILYKSYIVRVRDKVVSC